MDKLVSVLMSVHNEPSMFIDVAVKSICNQTYNNIEFVIIDDYSDDKTYNHLKQLSESHKIIKLYRNEENLGLTATLNKGLSLSNGDFIARMDADDYSCPERIAKQVEYLCEHPDIDILGTGVISFGEKKIFMSPINGFSPQDVQSNLFFTSSLCHPSVMIRRSFLCKTGLEYDEMVKKGQDFDLWERASIYGNLAVLKDVLLYYRTHTKQITSTNRKDQNITAEKIMRRRISRLGISPSKIEMKAHYSLKRQKAEIGLNDISLWIDKLINASKDIPYIDSTNFANHLHIRYVTIKLKARKIPNLIELRFLFKAFYDFIKRSVLLQRYSKTIEY